MSKICNVCKIVKELTSFHKDITRPRGYAAVCKNCYNSKRRERYKTTKQFWKERYLRKTYKMSWNDFTDMIAFQEGRCAICGVKEGDQLHIDHDHSTGKVRGLLCFNCNSGLGQFQDDQQLLYKASDYLKSFAIEKIPKEWLTGL